MRLAFPACLVPVLVLLSSCGTSPQQQRTVPADLEYAQDTKAAILEFQASARKNMRAAKGEIGALVENYEAYEGEPLGEHKATYDGIVQGLKEIQSLMSGSAANAQILAKIDEVANLARQLPGEAKR